MKDIWIAIANPAASGGRAVSRWSDVKNALNTSKVDYVWITTEARGDAMYKVKKAIAEGYRKFLSVGGDGTHHEVVNGFCQSECDLANLTLGIVPIGTGNDWARSLGISRDLQQAISVIKSEKTIAHRVGCVTFDDGRKEYFMNVAGMCMDAAVVQNVPAGLIRNIGGLAYLLGGVRELFTYKSPNVTIDVGGDHLTGRFLTMHAGFGNYCGGGMQFLPHSDFSAKTLAIMTIDAKHKWALLFNIHRLFNGSVLSLSAANSYTADTLSVRHSSQLRVPIEADGEFLGFSPFEITVMRDAMRVCVFHSQQ